jgi:hypothetical protein
MGIPSKQLNAILARRAVAGLPSKPKKLPRPMKFIPLRTWMSRSDGVMKGAAIMWLPIATVSETNDHSHYRNRMARAESHRTVTNIALKQLRDAGQLPPFPVRVTFSRVSQRPLDWGDNLNSSMKFIRDAIAKEYGVNDGDRRWEWDYDQDTPEPKCGVIVTIEPIGDLP